MYQKITIAAGLFVLLIGFQNCAETHFGSVHGSDVVAKGSLTQLDLNAPDVPPGDDASGTVSQNPPSDIPPANPPPHDDDSQDHASTDDSSSDDKDDSGLVACILVRHGKSLKLGYVSDSLDGVMAVSQSVCISVHACTEIVPKLFEVVGPSERGYCEHNPNVKRLTDAEVQTLVDQALAP